MFKQTKIIYSSFVLFLLTLLVGCSSYAINEGEAYIPNDEISKGPGIFSGKSGAFYLVGNNNAVTKRSSTRINNKQEAVSAINNKIEQLEKDKAELEMLKQQLNNKR